MPVPVTQPPSTYDHDVQLRATLIAVCWMAWVLIWIGTAVIFRPDSRDPSPRGEARSRRLWLRLLLAAFLILALRTHHPGSTSFDVPIRWLGVAVCAAGIGIATWARVCLGRNWGMPMTVRARPTLVRSGPYRVVRHPIYSGLLLAAIGSALVTGPGWLLVVIGAGAYFVVSLRVEETDMAAAFPEQYPEYARHTKRLIPFVY
jgi:protein-S-isoprenylcysteine O-methyltransferase Ste14